MLVNWELLLWKDALSKYTKAHYDLRYFLFKTPILTEIYKLGIFVNSEWKKGGYEFQTGSGHYKEQVS